MATYPSAGGDTRPDGIRVIVRDNGRPVRNATCRIYGPLPLGTAATAGTPSKKGAAAPSWGWGPDNLAATVITGRDGTAPLASLARGSYLVVCLHGPLREPVRVEMEPGCVHEACIDLGAELLVHGATAQRRLHAQPTAAKPILATRLSFTPRSRTWARTTTRRSGSCSAARAPIRPSHSRGCTR